MVKLPILRLAIPLDRWDKRWQNARSLGCDWKRKWMTVSLLYYVWLIFLFFLGGEGTSILAFICIYIYILFYIHVSFNIQSASGFAIFTHIMELIDAIFTLSELNSSFAPVWWAFVEGRILPIIARLSCFDAFVETVFFQVLKTHLSNEKNPGCLGYIRGLYYPVIWGLS